MWFLLQGTFLSPKIISGSAMVWVWTLPTHLPRGFQWHWTAEDFYEPLKKNRHLPSLYSLFDLWSLVKYLQIALHAQHDCLSDPKSQCLAAWICGKWAVLTRRWHNIKSGKEHTHKCADILGPAYGIGTKDYRNDHLKHQTLLHFL